MEDGAMAKPLVSDELWEIIEPLIPKRPRRKDGKGRPPIDNRKALTGIIFILKTGIPFEDLPQEMGCGSGMTCWRRLYEWNEAGVWTKLHQVLLEKLECAHRINWERAVIDASTVRAMHGGEKTGKNPTDRAKRGSKRHLLTDANGVILNLMLTAANRNEVTKLKELVGDRPAVRCNQKTDSKGRPRKRTSRKYRKPKKLLGDRGYDSEPHRDWLRGLGIEPKIARRRTGHGSGLGRFRWVVERGFAWMNQQGELRIRDSRLPQIYEAMLMLFAALVNLQFL
jgi:transposase